MTTVKLGDVVQITSGFAFPSSGFSTEEGIPLVRIRDVTRGVSETRYAGPFDEDYVVNDGDLLVGMDGEFNAALWRGGRALLNQRVCRLVPDPSRLDFGFLRHVLPRELKAIEDRTPFVTVKHLSVKDIRAIALALPPLAEQRRIATILDKADSLRRKRQQAIRLADTLRRSVFVQMFGDPDLNPKAWPILPMGDVIEFKGGSQPPKETFVSEPRPGYVRLVQIRDFKTDKYKTYIPEQLAKRSFDEDDVMVARYGPPVFQILRGLSGSYNVALMKAQPKPNVLKEFVFWLLQLPKYQSAVVSNSERTAGQTGVNLDFLNALDVPLPPLGFQEEIASAMVKISSTVEKQQAMLEESEKLLTSLQSQYFGSRALV